jgi:DNA-binding Lrp family transcriptional regulator
VSWVAIPLGVLKTFKKLPVLAVSGSWKIVASPCRSSDEPAGSFFKGDVLGPAMLTSRHVRILQQLRKDGRMSLARISRETRIATSTVFDYYKDLKREAITRHVVALDFSSLGYPLRKVYLIRNGNWQKALEWLRLHPAVNNLYRVDVYDAFFETYFRSVNEEEEFRQTLKQQLKPTEVKAYDILEELKHEAFVPGEQS